MIKIRLFSRSISKPFFRLTVFLFLTTIGCTPKIQQLTLTEQPALPGIASETPFPTVQASPTGTSVPVEPTMVATLHLLPPEPQTIEFTAEDGTKLVGTYYPAGVNPAPLVVLFHWVRGSQADWLDLAKWLQNRDEFSSIWLPRMPNEMTYAVFTFDFRGFGKSALPSVIHWEPQGWLMDARAAMKTARQLTGVDSNRYLTMGASIGGDATIDVCEEGCLGALSLSPGGYLTIPYHEAVERVAKLSPTPKVICLAAEGDEDSAQACRSASGDHYSMVIYPGSAHGMELLKPGYDPEIGELIFEFFKSAYEMP